MGILKYIWNAIFGKSKKQEVFGRGGSIDEPKLKVAYKAESVSGKIGAYNSEVDKLDKYKSCAFPDEVKNFCDISTPVNFGVCKTPNLDAEYITHIEKETSTVTFVKSKSNISKPKNKTVLTNWNKKVLVNSLPLNKEQQVIQYLLKYGSIDKRTCSENFGLKRLDNLICELRKQGMNIKNETVELHNELGEKTKVNNYRLVTSDGAN
jgi:hypothetical protein